MHYVCEGSSVWVSTVITACDKKHSRNDYIIWQSNVLDGLKLGFGFLLIVVNCLSRLQANKPLQVT